MIFLVYGAALADRRWALSWFLFMMLFPAVSAGTAFLHAYRHGFSALYLTAAAAALLPLLMIYGSWALYYLPVYFGLAAAGALAGNFARKRYRTLRVYAR